MLEGKLDMPEFSQSTLPELLNVLGVQETSHIACKLDVISFLLELSEHVNFACLHELTAYALSINVEWKQYLDLNCSSSNATLLSILKLFAESTDQNAIVADHLYTFVSNSGNGLVRMDRRKLLSTVLESSPLWTSTCLAHKTS